MTISVLESCFKLKPESTKDEDRSFVLIASTGAETPRTELINGKLVTYYEELVITPDSVILKRLKAGASLLNNHKRDDISHILGRTTNAWIEDGVLHVGARLSKRSGLDDLWQDIKDGIITSISMGYFTLLVKWIQKENTPIKTKLITKLEPFEISIVPVSADYKANIRSLTDDNNFHNETIIEGETDTMFYKNKLGRAMKTSEPAITASTNADVVQNSTSESSNAVSDIKTETRSLGSANTTDVPKSSVFYADLSVLCAKRSLNTEQTHNVLTDALDIQHGKKLITQYALENFEKTNPIKSHSSPVYGTDHCEIKHMQRGIENALASRIGVEEIQEIGASYRGISFLDSIKCLNRDLSGYDRNTIAERGINSALFGDALHTVVNKVVKFNYGLIEQPYKPLINPMPLSDFKTTNLVDTTIFTEFEKTPEGAPPTQGHSTNNTQNSIKLETFQKKLSITRQAIINDEIGLLQEIPKMFGRGAALTEKKIIMNLFSDLTYKMADGHTVFCKDHGNLATIKGIPSAKTFEEGDNALAAQVALDGNRIGLYGCWLIVPKNLENSAYRALAPVNANKAEDINIYANRFQLIVDPSLDSINPHGWYMTANPIQYDIVKTAYLAGSTGSQLRKQQNFDTLSIDFIGLLDFAAAISSYKGVFYNPGK